MTSSFVAKILEHADQLEQKSIHEKLDTLTSKLGEMEVEMYQLAQSRFINFHPNFVTADSLVHRVHDVQSEVSAIERKFDTEIKGQLSLSVGEFHNLNDELSKAKIILTGLTYLSDVYDLFEISGRSLEEKKYSKAAVALLKLEEYLSHPLSEHDEKIKIIGAMNTELRVQFAQLECDLSDLWKDMVKWNVKTSSEPGLGACVTELTVSVTCEGEGTSELQELVEGLHVSSLLACKMKPFTDWFQKYLVPFVLDNMYMTIAVKSADQTQTLYITSQDKQPPHKPDGSKSKDISKSIQEEKMYVYVFANLLNILESLHSLFLHAEYGGHDTTKLDVSSVADVSESSAGSSKGTLMSLLGQAVSPWLLDLLQKTVMAKAVPSSSKDLAGFNEVIVATRLLQDQLQALGFIQPDNITLEDYVRNINMLFANKKSQATLEKAHALMTSDLHDTVAVTEDKPMGEWPPLTRGGVKKGIRAEVAADHQLSDNTFKIPKCRISENVQTLMTLAYDTLSEATESSPDCATQMFYAVRHMFELFYHVVPTHHGHSFETFPQIAALHHNNCMFIAHHLMTLGHQFAPKLPEPDGKTFVDLIQRIRRSGVEVFLSQISRQSALLQEYLDLAAGFAKVEDETSFNNADKAVKQVRLQLGHLHKIWKPVLPVSVYKKAMGKLIESVVERISDNISSLEDIAQDAANRLADLLTSIEQECGDLMTSPGEVASVELVRHIPRWARLPELKFMMAASLSSIADRWAEGSGPLALAFTPLEVKQLIRALFQNTDRRAHLLATIK